MSASSALATVRIVCIPVSLSLFLTYTQTRPILSNGIHPSSLISHVSPDSLAVIPTFSKLVLPPGHVTSYVFSTEEKPPCYPLYLSFYPFPSSTAHSEHPRRVPGAPAAAAAGPLPRWLAPTTLTFLFLLQAPSCPHHARHRRETCARARAPLALVIVWVQRAQPPTREGCRSASVRTRTPWFFSPLATPRGKRRVPTFGELQRELCKLCLWLAAFAWIFDDFAIDNFRLEI